MGLIFLIKKALDYVSYSLCRSWGGGGGGGFTPPPPPPPQWQGTMPWWAGEWVAGKFPCALVSPHHRGVGKRGGGN